MNQIHKPVYDFELMEQLNSFLVVSLVLTGTPARYSKTGQPFSFLDMLPVTDLDVETNGVVSPKQGAGQ
ncbi:MAG: hypothetical protein L0Z50_41905 [Verrucomicrobiales bacterium]|nr:hypothetical protein [Verrucomicrobiales bacterium]